MAEKQSLLGKQQVNYTSSSSTPTPYNHTTLAVVNENVAPAQVQIFLEYRKITAVVKGKKILHSVSGSFAPGTLTAIIGTSGAGKTTLLNILAGFQNNVPGLQVSGDVMVNGMKRDKSTFRKNSAFIMQDDFLMPTLTPQEALMFCANMRLPAAMSVRAKGFKVQAIIDQLGMQTAKDVMTGHPEGDKGLSGGQRKRLSIALEMLTEPPLLFLDEPTSGLDSTTSLQLGKLLRNLANAGHTVIATVHQPSAALFRLFDNVVVMSAGEIAYEGATKQVHHALSDVGVECPLNENPADWILTMANDPQASMFLVGANQEKKHVSRALPPPLVRQKKAIVPGITKFGLLFKRSVICTLRDRVLTRARLGSHIFMGIIIGLLYLKMENDQANITDRLALLFFSLTFLMLVALMPTVLTFPVEKAIFLREHQNNWYGIGVYYLAKSMADVPMQIIFPFVYGAITFFMTEVYPDDQPQYVQVFFKMQLIYVLQTLTAQALGVTIGITAPTLQTSIFAAPMIAIPNLLFCGFLVKIAHITWALRWIAYIEYVRFALQGLVRAVFDNMVIRCARGEEINGVCPVTSGMQVVTLYGYQHLSYWECVGILGAFFVFFRLLGYIILKVKVLTKK